MQAADAIGLRERWEAAWGNLGAGVPDGLFTSLVACYAEPARSYHTLRHLQECFAALEPAANLADRLAEVETAIWFHDAVYDSRRNDNEERSASWAEEALLSAGVESAIAARIGKLIIETRHLEVPEAADAKLLCDVDLAILGADQRRFREYERQVRQEYAWVPEPDFRRGRSRILQTFLARPRIYATDLFAERLEVRARENLLRSIQELNEPPPNDEVRPNAERDPAG